MADENNLRLVKKLETLLENNLEKCEIVENVKTTRLTAPGDNYGSLMLSLEIQTKNTKTNQNRTLYLVGKTLQESELFQKIFKVQTTFKNEISFYTTVFPELNKFLKSYDNDLTVDFVPKCFGGRINLNGNDGIVDDNACLLLENVKVKGYTTLPKKLGFNLECAKFALDGLAKLHGSSLAFKIKRPELFERYVKPYLTDFSMSPDMFTAASLMLQEVMKKFKYSDESIKKAATTFDRSRDQSASKKAREPWSCVLHNDTWVNNILMKLDEAQQPENVLLVDFQVCEYKSPVRDVIFFLFTSVQVDVLKEHLDELLEHYYHKLVGILQKLKVDTDEFSWDSYMEELRFAAKDNEFSHILMMLQPIFREATEDVNNEDFRNNAALLYPFPSGLHLDKVLFCIEQFEKRGWCLG